MDNTKQELAGKKTVWEGLSKQERVRVVERTNWRTKKAGNISVSVKTRRWLPEAMPENDASLLPCLLNTNTWCMKLLLPPKAHFGDFPNVGQTPDHHKKLKFNHASMIYPVSGPLQVMFCNCSLHLISFTTLLRLIKFGFQAHTCWHALSFKADYSWLGMLQMSRCRSVWVFLLRLNKPLKPTGADSGSILKLV